MEVRGNGTSNWDQENPFSSIDVVEIKGFSFFPRPMLVGAPSGSDSRVRVGLGLLALAGPHVIDLVGREVLGNLI